MHLVKRFADLVGVDCHQSLSGGCCSSGRCCVCGDGENLIDQRGSHAVPDALREVDHALVRDCADEGEAPKGQGVGDTEGGEISGRVGDQIDEKAEEERLGAGGEDEDELEEGGLDDGVFVERKKEAREVARKGGCGVRRSLGQRQGCSTVGCVGRIAPA